MLGIVETTWTLSILLVGISGISGQGPGFWPGYGGAGSRTTFQDNDAKVLVLGAGPAGLQAVKYLTDNGVNDYILIEGAAEVGGKLKKVNFGTPIRQYETGAMWIYPPTKRLLDRYGVQYHRNNWNSVNVRSDRGVDITYQIQQRWRDLQNATNSAKRIVRDIANGRRPDVSMKTALAMFGWIDSSPADHTLEWFDFDFEEGVQSKDVSFYGRSQKDFEAHEQYFITDRGRGLFSDVIQRLDADHLRANKVVTTIDQSGRDKRVTVTTQDGTRYTGDYALVTFSIGVLQRGNVKFIPPLPAWKTEQIFRYQMGTLDPIFMRFQRKFWGNEEWILHASERRGNRHYYPAFLNLEATGLFPRGTNTLVGFVTGEEAMRLETLRDSDVRTEVWQVLKSMFGAANVPNIQEFYFERWATDPLHYGTFSTWPIGADTPPDARQRLEANINRVFFAQDAADKAIGTVWQVLKSMFGASSVPNIQEFYFERWATNEFHYGSFSTWPVGADRPRDARQRLAAHVGRVFFAQDATDKAIGTVSGSVNAGERSARSITACLKNQRNCPRPYQPRNTGPGRPPGCPVNNQGGGTGDGSRLRVLPLITIFASVLSLVLTILI